MQRFRSLIATVVVLCFTLVVFSGCTTRIGDFTLMSTKNVVIGEKYVKVAENVEADDLAWWILFIPTGFPNFKTAVDNLLEQNKGELATNTVLSSYSLWLLLVNQVGYKIKGDVWKRASVGDLQNGTETFELRESNDGSQVLVSTKDESKSYTVTTPADLEEQYNAISGSHSTAIAP